MVKIRLSRVGAKGQPYYRIVAVDERKKRDGKVIEVLGRYNPRTEPITFEIDRERLGYWRGVGAQLTEPVQVLLGEAKPKFHQPKNVKKETPAAGSTDPIPVPAEGAGEVKVDAPEETPAPSAELAKVEDASESISPEATSEEVAQTIENTKDIVRQEVAEQQPTTQEEPVAEAETTEGASSETEPTETSGSTEEPKA